jgi:hypothetical protein
VSQWGPILSLIVEEHRQYLADRPRVESFRRAIAEIVQPGHVVVDLGAGTGILGLLACQAGAKKVYSIEESSMIELTRAISTANGFANRTTFIKGLSTRVELPERADVVVTDQIGRFGFDAGLCGYLEDARKRFLKPDGICIPSRFSLWLAPVQSDEFWSQVQFWKDSRSQLGFDVSPAYGIAANTGYVVKLQPADLIAEPQRGALIDPSTASVLRLQMTFSPARGGVLHGLGGWFSAQLSPSASLTNSPLSAERINRSNVFFPVREPFRVSEHDQIRVDMQILPDQKIVAWKVCVGDGHTPVEKAFRHSTFEGMLICKEDLRKTQPTFVPKLDKWGEARLSLLTLCDGHRTLREIEREVFQRHPAIFGSLAEAEEFVAEVVTRYSV